MRRMITVVVAVLGLVLVGPTAMAGDDGDYDGHNTDNGTILDGVIHGDDETPDNTHPGNIHHGPVGPVYEDYWTPSCSANGPPNQGADAMCMGATAICQTRGLEGEIFMRHYRRIAGSDDPWEFVGNECRGADDPVQQQPQVTAEMVLDQAYAAAPHPTAVVQPGTRSFVNVPNNYYADAPGETVNVEVLGQPIAVTFTVGEITWDFGDGSSGVGEGVEDADLGAPGAVEHAYSRQGSYAITATSSVGVQFTLPNGENVNDPGAFSFTSEPVTLPVGEVQTRVDSTN